MTEKIKTHTLEKLFDMLIIRKHVYSFTSEFTVIPSPNSAAKLKKTTQWY